MGAFVSPDEVIPVSQEMDEETKDYCVSLVCETVRSITDPTEHRDPLHIAFRVWVTLFEAGRMQGRREERMKI